MAKSDVSEVRRAMDGPDVDHDRLIGFCAARNDEDAERASSAGESRQMIGEFLEDTGMNGKALSWLRAILKSKNRDKAMDIIRSLEHGLPMVKAHLVGQQSEMDLTPTSDVPPAMNVTDDDDLPAPSYQANFDPTGDADIDGDTDAFDRHLAKVAAQ